MKKITLSTLLLATLLLANEEPSFTTHSELSYINSDGNTKSQSFAANFSAEKILEANKFRFNADAFYSESRQAETKKTVMDKNRWSAIANYDYDITEHFALNYLVENIADRFSGYDNRFNTGPGVIARVIESETQSLNIQTNILYSRDDISIAKEGEIEGEIESEIEEFNAILATVEYSWDILDNLKLKQELVYESNIKDNEAYFVISKTAVENKLSDVFSLGASYKVDYINQKVASYYTDRIFLLSLIIDY